MARFTVKITFFVLLATLLHGCGGQRLRIRGDVKGLEDGWVRLSRYTLSGLQPIDSALSRNGRFALSVPEMIPDILYLTLTSADGYTLPVVITDENITVAGNLNHRERIAASGTHENRRLGAYRDLLEPINVKLHATEKQLEAYRDSVALADSATYARLTGERRHLMDRIASLRADFVRESPSDIVSAMIVSGEVNAATTPARLDSLIGELDTEHMRDNAFLRRLEAKRNSLIY